MDLNAFKTRFVIVGGVATSLYMPLRLTVDLDILIDASDADDMALELSASGGVFVGKLAFGGTSWDMPGAGRLDVLESTAPWISDALGKPNRSPSGLPVIALPYLVLMKLDASRGQDLADLSRMLGQADEATRAAVRQVVGRYRPADLPDLESLIALGELEFTE